MGSFCGEGAITQSFHNNVYYKLPYYYVLPLVIVYIWYNITVACGYITHLAVHMYVSVFTHRSTAVRGMLGVPGTLGCSTVVEELRTGWVGHTAGHTKQE